MSFRPAWGIQLDTISKGGLSSIYRKGAVKEPQGKVTT